MALHGLPCLGYWHLWGQSTHTGPGIAQPCIEPGLLSPAGQEEEKGGREAKGDSGRGRVWTLIKDKETKKELGSSAGQKGYDGEWGEHRGQSTVAELEDGLWHTWLLVFSKRRQ